MLDDVYINELFIVHGTSWPKVQTFKVNDIRPDPFTEWWPSLESLLLYEVAKINMILCVTFSLELHIPMTFYYYHPFFYQVKMFMFYYVQITSSAFVGKESEMYNI